LHLSLRSFEDSESKESNMDAFRRGMEFGLELAKRGDCAAYNACSDRWLFMGIANPRGGGGADAGCQVACVVQHKCP
jgi:hypothetical protein